MKAIEIILCCAVMAIASKTVVTVKTSGTYTSLQAAVTGVGAMTSDTAIISIDTVIAGGDGGVTFNTFPQGKVLICTTTAACRHAGEFSTSKYYIATTAANGWENDAGYLKLVLQGIQFRVACNADWDEKYGVRLAVAGTGTQFEISQCIFDGVCNTNGNKFSGVGCVGYDPIDTVKIQSCGFYASGKGGSVVDGVQENGTPSKVFVYNCTFNGFTIGVSRAGSGTVVAKNCGFISCTDDFVGTVTATTCSETTPTLQSGKKYLLDPADVTWLGQGTSLASDAGKINTLDIKGSTITTWPIGADYESATPPCVPTKSGSTWTACDATHDGVQAAIDSAAHGDTVAIPADTAVWKAYVSITKGITLRGAGTTTSIIDSGTTNTFRVTGDASHFWRISHLKITANAEDNMIIAGGIYKGWVIDSCTFTNLRATSEIHAVVVGNYEKADSVLTYGLVHHCTLENCGFVAYQGYGHKAWRDPLALGTYNATYIEDCTISQDLVASQFMDANHGGRFVVRYNTIRNAACDNHSLQNPFPPSDFGRAGRAFEVYKNTFSANGGAAVYDAIWMRGGTGVIFNNTVTNVTGDAYNYAVILDNVRSAEEKGTPLLSCDGTNSLDGNADSTGWPCLDQIGRSTDNGGTRLPQDSTPTYIWSNTMDGDTVGAYIANGCGNWIKKNRDYFETAPTTYYAYTYPHPLTGTSKSMAATSLSGDTIKGAGFGATQKNGFVKLGTSSKTIASWSATKIVFDTAGISSGTYKIFIRNNDFQVDSSLTYTKASENVSWKVKKPRPWWKPIIGLKKIF